MGYRDNKTIVSEIGSWLMEKGIPYQRYDNLSAYLKVVLHNLVFMPTCLTTARERKDLYINLCLPDIGRDLNPDDLVPTDEELRKFFTPVSPSETFLY